MATKAKDSNTDVLMAPEPQRGARRGALGKR